MTKAPTAKELSGWLQHSGTLVRGTVTDVSIELEIKTAFSTLVFLTACYSTDAKANLPNQLVIKSPFVTSTNTDGGSELYFYQQLASTIGSPPLVRCLATLDDGNKEVTVLEDLRATHDHPPWPMPPSLTDSKLAIEALARIHTRWWEAPTLGHSVGQLHTTGSLTNMVEGIAAQLPAFIDHLGDRLTADSRKIFERVFSSTLRPWMRLTDHRALTLIQGDAHTWNFLFPRSGQGEAFLIDWQTWHIDVGARDLAFFMALHWYPGRRNELERPLLRHYHECLLAQGRTDYSFDDLWLDYRRCAVRNLTIPIIFWGRGMTPEGWWHRLECALAAYRDLGCEELL